MPLCQCGLEYAYFDSDTQRKFNHNEQPHVCRPQPKPIPLYMKMNGIDVPYSQNYVAHMITNEAVRCGLNPWTVQTERRGDFIVILKQ